MVYFLLECDSGFPYPLGVQAESHDVAGAQPGPTRVPSTPCLSTFIFGRRAKRRRLVHVSAAAGKALEKKSRVPYFFLKKQSLRAQRED